GRSQNCALLEPDEGLAPVALTGGLVGSVVDRCGLPTQARVLVRDNAQVVVAECYTGAPRAGCASGRFEVCGLPTGSYTVDVAAPGFAPQRRHGVRVEALCVTDIGPVRLMRAESPSITVTPNRESVRPLLPRPPLLFDGFI